MKLKKSKQTYDYWLVIGVVSLISIGLLMVASASIDIAFEKNGFKFYYLVRQLLFLSLGVFFAALVLAVPLDSWQKNAPLLLIICVALLILVLIPGIGRVVNGSSRWLGIGLFNLQVSEVAKIGVLIYLADYLSRHEHEIKTTLWGFAKPMLIFLIIAALLLLEPDFGATAVIFVTILGVMFIAGVKLWQFIVLFMGGVTALIVLAITAPYRWKRLTTFLDPWENQFDSGYQLTQSLIAFGRGGWFGSGLGDSVQKLFYLPEAHTDFLFAVLAEELGLFGVLVVIGLFALVVGRGFMIARYAQLKDKLFAAFIAYGISLMFAIQAIVNMGVSTGMLPTKGLTLPFMSYGGSSMVVCVVLVAFLLRIDREMRKG